MTRALYRPGRSNAPPRGASLEARAASDAVQEALLDPTRGASVPYPLHATPDQDDSPVAERMRTITLVERIDIEIALTQRFARAHT
jgi:hypothetical protein